MLSLLGTTGMNKDLRVIQRLHIMIRNFNTKVYGTYTCNSDVMTKAINARYGYYAAA